MSFHSESVDSSNHALTANTYADITARDADTDFNTALVNVNKIVRVEDADGSGNIGYFILTSITPTWESIGSSITDEWTELGDTPSSISAGLVVQGNSSGTALEFGQNLTSTGSPQFTDLILTGNLTVQGTTTTLDTTTLLVEDKNIEIGKVTTPTDITADGGGITLLGSTNKTINWINSTDSWTFNQNIQAVRTTFENTFIDVRSDGSAGDWGEAAFRLFTNQSANEWWIYMDKDNVADLPNVKSLGFWNGSNNVVVFDGVTEFVGIGTGTRAPTERLEVVGNILATDLTLGNITTPTDITADGKGITLKGTTDKTITWIDSTDSWNFNQTVIAESQLVVGGTSVPATDASIDLKATDKVLVLNHVTTTTRDTITQEGGIIYNTTNTDLEFFNGTSWISAFGGDVVGPASSTDNAIARFNGTDGKNIQNSNVFVNDTGDLGVRKLNPKEALHVLASTLDESGYTGNATTQGILVTGDIAPALIIENTGNDAGERVVELGYGNGVFSFSHLNDAGTAFVLRDILKIGIDGEFRTLSNQANTLIKHDNEATENIANTIQQSHRLKFTGSVVAEATRMETSFTDIGATTNTSRWQIYTKDQNVLDVRMSIVGSKIGIGTTAPNSKLDVNGDINIGDITQGYKIGDNTVLFASDTTFDTLVGVGAGAALTSGGTQNTAVGYQALNSGVTADNSTAIGYQALFSHSGIVSLNTAVGSQALFSNISGTVNTAVGQRALFSSMVSNNTAVGTDASQSSTTGTGNTAVGLSALNDNIVGNNNSALGEVALASSLGDENTALGSKALEFHTTGDSQTALGFYAGAFISGGVTQNVLSSDSVYLGAESRALASGDTNEIVIGFQATGIGSNTAVLGNDSIVTTVLKGNVGIGTTTPDAKLQVGTKTTGLGSDGSDTSVFFGSVNFSSGAASVAPLALFDDNTSFAAGTGGGIIFGGTYRTDGSEVGAGIQGIRESSVAFEDDWGLAFYTSFNDNILNEVVRFDKDGNVGIGTASPSSKLDVNGSVNITDNLIVQNNLTVDTNTLFVDAVNNRVGIGTTNPQFKLDVFGSVQAIQLITNVLNQNTVYFTSEADLPAPSGGVITLQENTSYVMYNDDPTTSQKQVTLTNKLQIPDAGGCRITGVGLATALLVYTGTGTFITTSDTFTGFLSIDELFMSAPNGTLFDIDGVLPVGQEFFPRIFLNSMGVFDTDTIGTIKTISVNFNVGAFFDCSQGLVLDGVDEFLIGDWRFANWKNTVGSVMITAKNSLRFPKIQNCTLETNINETAFNIFPSIGDETFVIGGNSYRGEGELYATGVSGTITSVTNVTDSGSVALVEGTTFGEVVMASPVGSDLVEGQFITTSGFFVEPNYNGTFEVLEVGVDANPNKFRIHAPFTVTDTGSWNSNRIEFFAVNSLSVGDGVQVTGTVNYDAGYRVLERSGTAFVVNGTFVANETGSFNTDSLTETDPRMRVVANAGIPDSKVIASGGVNANTNNTTVTDGTYAAIDVTGTTENTATQRFKLTNMERGQFTYIGQEDLAAELTAVISATKTGTTRNYRFAISIDGAIPVFASASYAPMEVQSTKVNATILKPINITTNQTVQIMAAGDGTADNITITDFSIEIRGD